MPVYRRMIKTERISSVNTISLKHHKLMGVFSTRTPVSALIHLIKNCVSSPL